MTGSSDSPVGPIFDPLEDGPLVPVRDAAQLELVPLRHKLLPPLRCQPQGLEIIDPWSVLLKVPFGRASLKV